jgi:transcription elongation factor GreA
VSDVLVTRDGMEGLIAEIEHLYVERDAFVRRIGQALENGGAVPENGEYLDARHDKQLLDVRIAELERRRSAAEIVVPVRDGDLDIGEQVSVRDLATREVFHYRIVGTGESDPSVGRVSHESPVGSALLGRAVGDVVDVDIPSGALRLEVIAVDG